MTGRVTGRVGRVAHFRDLEALWPQRKYLADALWVVPANYIGRETGVMAGNLPRASI